MRTWRLAQNNVRRFLREKNALFIYIVLPVLIFTGVMKVTIGGSSSITVYVADEDKTGLSEAYVSYLEKQEHYHIVPITITEDASRENADEQIYTAKGLQHLIEELKLSTYIRVGTGFEEAFYGDEALPLKVYGLSESQNLQSLVGLNNHFVNTMKGLYIGSGRDAKQMDELMATYEKGQVTMTTQYTSDHEGASGMAFALGILIYFILLTSVKISALAVQDRDVGVYERLASMPVKTKHYLGGYTLSTGALVCLQIGLSVGVMVITGTDLEIPIPQVVMVLGLFALCGISISFFIIALVRKKNMVEILTNGVVMFTSMLAGIFWPYHMMPRFMQSLAKLFPQYWALDMIENLLDSGGLAHKGLNIAILSVMTVMFFGSATAWMSRRKVA